MPASASMSWPLAIRFANQLKNTKNKTSTNLWWQMFEDTICAGFRQAAAGNCHVCAWQLPEREGEGCESGSQWPFSEHRFLQRIGYSWNEHHEGAPAGWVAKWVHLPRALAQRASHFGSSWAALLKIRDNQGSSQLGRWDTTKGPVFLLWHLSFPPWKLWVTTLHYTTHTTLH